jgi:CheY-like chemotaxis protein
MRTASRLEEARSRALRKGRKSMSGSQPIAQYRVLVVSPDGSLREELRAGFCGEGREEQHAEQAVASAATPAPVYALDQASDAQTAVEFTRQARAAAEPYHLAVVEVDPLARDAGLATAALLRGGDPELHVILCVAEADCAWAEQTVARNHPGQLLALRRPVDPFNARQMVRALNAGRNQGVLAQPAAEPGADWQDSGMECGRTRVAAAHLDLLADGVAAGLSRTVAAFKEQLDAPRSSARFAAEGQNLRQREIVLSVHRAASLVSQLAILGCDGPLAGEAVDLNQPLERAAAHLRRLLKGMARVETQPAPEPATVPAEAAWLEQLISDLGLLAVRGTPPGGSLRLSVVADAAGTRAATRPDPALTGTIRLTVVYCEPETAPAGAPVSAAGPGLNAHGTGLEWTVAETIVTRLGGRIREHPAANGSVGFEVCLPRAQAASQVCQNLPAEPPASENEDPPSPTVVEPTPGKTVLLVEDDEAVREVTRLVLQDRGCRILEAGDSAEALRLWQENRDSLDLLIVDLVIPGLVDGLQLANRLRAERADLKVILTTGFAGSAFIAELEASRGVEFLPKPFTYRQIQGVLSRCLEACPA